MLAGLSESVKMVPAGTGKSKIEGEHKNGAFQDLHTGRESQKVFVPLADTLGLVN